MKRITAASLLLIATLSACSTRSAPIHRRAVDVASDNADADVRRFQLRALEARLRMMAPGLPSDLRTLKNLIGSLESELTVNGIREQWLLDTGANQSVVTRSFAERLGLTPLTGVASVGSGVTGLKSPLQAALVPTLHLGGATVSNVVVLILDDANLRVGDGSDSYQIDAILGYPVLKALGRITFTHDGEFLAGENVHRACGDDGCWR